MKSSLPILFLLATGLPRLNWEDRQALPRGVAGGAAAAFDGHLVYAGGTNWSGGVKHWLPDVYLYDIAADRWRPGPPLPVPLAYGAWSRSAGALEVYGGTDGQHVYRESWRLESGKTAWTPTGKAPSDTLMGRAERIGDRVYLFGGCSDVADLTRCADTVQVREPGGTWHKVSTLPQGALAMPASAVARGRAYLFGGCSMPAAGKLINRDDAWSFNPSKNQWRRLRPLPHANRGLTSAVLGDRYILLSGGYTATQQEAAGKPADFGFTAAVMAYDIETDTYTDLTPLPFPVAGMEILVSGDRLFGIGGEHKMKERADRLISSPLPRQ